ncbi:beta strand repeat-containing protein [Flavobacterium ammonificans]|uniref:beta strand repeat-containing protein n=1 Tax=Flavobacterium ammonificans TaxID=1751056 RepID=UPI001E335B7A|nr:hypothetical protein [Flavobacterium ammonificans]BDB57323.1 hypothetical protein SHINM13_16190 [Flavobacterium ammonificans]
MKKTLLFLAFILSTFSFAQTNGITYQAVIYSANGESVPGINNANAPLANRKICLQFSIVDDFLQTEYQEKVIVTTDDYGMVNLIIGTGNQTGGYANSFESIVWNSAKKYLKVSLDQSGYCNSFDEISNQVLSYVPFALAANSASSVSGIVGIANGGTNSSTVLGAKTNLQLQNVDNTTDLNKPISTLTQLALDSKVDKVVGKNLSTEDFTTAEKTKLASLGGTLDLSSYATITDLTTKVDKVAGKELSSNDYTTLEKNKLAAISGVNTGDQDLSALATAASVALKADIFSPSLLGVPTAPTASSNTNTTQIATTAFVNTTVANKFVDLTTNQTIAGTKTFNSDIIANGLIIGKGKGQNNYNTVFGAGALNSSNANGTRNTAIGYLALTQYAGTTFDNNTGVGYFNMIGLTTGYGNTSIGAETMFNVGTASNNTGIGNQSLINAAGDNNVGVGARSGDGLTTGTNNTFIGTQARTTSAGATISNATALGYGAVVTENNTIQLGNLGVTNVKTSGKLTTGAITLPNTDGTTGQILTTNGAGVVAWSSPTNISISTINETPNSNGATIANGVIKLSPADATNGGIVTTGNQTYSGNKIVIGNFETQTSMDTPVKDINANNPTSPVGAPDQEARQSFTAGISGYLSNIKVKLFSSGTYTVSIYKGGNVMSENNPGGIQLFQSTFTSINNVMSSIPITNTPITAGDIYWIKISGTSLNVGLNWGQNNVGTTVSFPNYRGGISQSWIFETYVSQLIGGNITVAGSITSSGFKTPTGTSSQYLMADGSVSSSTLSNYLPLSGGNMTGQLSIGTNSPESSAVLNVVSTTQGFLPPRMNKDQRNGINNPLAGLIVWCKNCGENGELQVYNGTNWTNFIGGATSEPLVVGSSYKGGKIAYIFQSGDPGYVAGEFHGIIASNSDLSNGIRWGQGNDGLSTTYDCVNRHSASGFALPCAIGAGRSNTSLIIASNTESSPTDYAALICSNYSVVSNGVTYNDWFLPSKDEMLKLYQNKNLIGGLFYDSTNASSKSNWYWTSSGDVFQDRATDVNSSNANNSRSFRGSLLSVRAVMYF